MASKHGPSMQAFVGPQNMDRQDIGRLTNFNKILQEYERAVHQGGQPPSISAIREKYDTISAFPFQPLTCSSCVAWSHLSTPTDPGAYMRAAPAVFEPMVTSWLSTPSTAAGVIRFVVAELGPEFTGAEVQSQISKSGFANLLNQTFIDTLSSLGNSGAFTKDSLLDLFYEHHSDELPLMPGEITERPTNDEYVPAPGSCAESYTQIAMKAKAVAEHRAFRALIGVLIIGVVLITGMDTYNPADLRVSEGSDSESEPRAASSQSWIATTEAVIIFVFVSEVVLKFVAQGMRPWRFFHVRALPGTAPYVPHDHMQFVFNFRHWLGGFQGWNVFDFVVVLICVAQQVRDQEAGSMVVLRMVRLIKVLQIFMEVDQIRAVLIGLAGGLHSLIFVLLVFSVIFYVYGLVGIHLFGVTDEFHFSDMFSTFTTMSRMAMGPWQDVLFINLYGCLDDRAQLGTPQIHAIFCDAADHQSSGINNDSWRRIAVMLYFITFKAVCGFVALSLLFGVITTAMSKALAETNERKFEALRMKRQHGAHKMLIRRRNAARMEAEVDTVQRYSTKWWSIAGKIEVGLEAVEGVSDDPNTNRRRRVYVTKATGLPLSDGSASNPKAGDPYAVVYWNDEELYRTDIVYNSVNPEWDESAIICVPLEGGTLRVEIFDWDADEAVLPGVSRCDSFQGEVQLSIGLNSDSLGGADCVPATASYNLTEHIVWHESETEILADAAEAAAVPPKQRTPAQLAAVSKSLQTIRWFQVNCPNTSALLQVSKYVKKKELAEGDVLFEHGANANSMYVVFSGTILLQQSSGKIVARLGSGATVGERALMGDMDELMENVDDQFGSDSDQEDDIDASKRYCKAVAQTDAVVGRLSRGKFYNVPNRRAGASGGDVTGLVLQYKRISLRTFSLVNEDWFHWVIIVCILVQAVVLGLETTVKNHELIDASNEPFWAFVNVTLRLIFTCEVVLKVVAFLNPWQEWSWFTDPWTLFDAAIVMMSWLPFTPQGLLLLRVLRLFRVLKEFNSLPQLQMIVNGLIDAIAGLWFVMLLLCLTVYFYSIIGLQIFGLNDYRFRTLDSALLTLASTATEGGWPAQMYTNMYGCRDYYTAGHRCCTENDRLGTDDTPFGMPSRPPARVRALNLSFRTRALVCARLAFRTPHVALVCGPKT